MVVALRLMPGHAPYERVAAIPSSYGFSRFAGNPNITNVGLETFEMYNPAAFKATNGDIWAYAKGAARIYAWKSTDGGETFSIQNGGNQVVGPGAGGAWDNGFALEPCIVYDEANGTIHLWYKGYNSGATVSGWGHATAADSDPLTFTKDAGNPILTQSTVQSAIGGTVTDLSIGSVALIGSTYHFYGYCHVTDRYRLIHATGTTWNDPGSVTSILTATNTTTHSVVETPDVFLMTGGGSALYAMFYSEGAAQPGTRTIRAAYSRDGSTWDFSDTSDILSPTSGWESNEVYSGHMLKVSTTPFLLPIVDNLGRWRFYYSGLDNASHAQAGLAYMTPVWP